MNLYLTTITAKTYRNSHFDATRLVAEASLFQILKTINLIGDQKKLLNLANIINLITIIGRDDSDQYFLSQLQIPRPSLDNIIAYLKSSAIGLDGVTAQQLVALSLHTGYFQLSGWFGNEYKTVFAQEIYTTVINQLSHNNQSKILSDRGFYQFIHNQKATEGLNLEYEWLFIKINYYVNEKISTMLFEWVENCDLDKAEKEIRIEATKSILFNYALKQEHLDLSNLRLTQLPPNDCLNQLTYLKTLNLSFNRLTTLPEQSFFGLTNLVTLNLSYNGITTVPPKLFAGLIFLNKLNLSGNQIKHIPSKIFADLKALRYLNLKGCYIENFPPELFINLCSLEKLNLRLNHIKNLPFQIFHGLERLRKLDLCSNQIESFPHGIFNSLKSLESLHLYNNKIVDMGYCLTVALPHLVVVNLDRNFISIRNKGSFSFFLNLGKNVQISCDLNPHIVGIIQQEIRDNHNCKSRLD